MKKSSLILGSFLGLGIMVSGVVAATMNFSDVPADHWAKSAVDSLSTAGVIKGYADNTFKGNQNITRYETAVIVDKNNGLMQAKMDSMSKSMANMQEKMDAMQAQMGGLTDLDIKAMFGEIKKVYESNGHIYIDFDDVKWLTWNANKAEIIADMEKKDPGACKIEEDCMPLEGFYILNNSETVQKLEIDSAEIKLLDPKDVSNFKNHTAKEFNTLFNGNDAQAYYGSPYFNLQMLDGEINLIHQKYSV